MIGSFSGYYAVFDTVPADQQYLVLSQPGNLNRRKLKPGVNDTTFDRWYFDAVSTASKNESLTIAFYNSGSRSLCTLVGCSVSRFLASLLMAPPIKNDENGFLSVWHGAGAFFAGISLEQGSPKYTVTIDNPAIGINGTLTLKSL
ncbi:hypothetical protein CT0861_11015 [Colletotrichum tofieldiae]|uniref:Diels-Alderase N-terminal domain-containing protein n=1 Tax=Colletotrichum tofieldiae TaxID=708197 RepID=A0A166U0C3_9PEZI|nr:hypothetical protein CT0861_11015 [Colletotrichum tofieldiae]